MLKIMSADGKATVRVEGSIAEIAFDLTIAVRGLIESFADQNEMCVDMLLEFCKHVLPKLADPKVSLDDIDDIDDIMDKAVEEHRKAAQEEAKKSLKQIKEMLKDDDGLIKTIRDILDDLEDDAK